MKYKSYFYPPKLFGSACITSIFMKVISIPFTLISANLLSDIVTNATKGDVSLVLSDSVIVLVIALVSWILQVVMDIETKKKQITAENKSRANFLEALLNNSLNKLFQADIGELNENLNDDIQTTAKRYMELYPSLISSLLVIGLYIYFLSVQNLISALTLLGISLFQLLPPIIVKRFLQHNYDECRDIEAKITDHIFEAVNGYEMIKLYGLKQWWLSKMIFYHKSYLSIGHKADAIAAIQRSMYKMLDIMMKFGTCIIMGVYIMLGYSSPDIAIKAVYLSGGIFSGVQSLFSTIPQFAVSRKAMVRLNKWLEHVDHQSSTCPDTNVNNIILSDLRYRYPGNTGYSVVDGVNYEFDVNKSYLLKGVNGTGKTTIFNLISGLILPDSGNVIAFDRTISNKKGDIPAHLNGILYIPQIDSEFGFSAEVLFNMFSEPVRESIFFLARCFGLKDDNIVVPIANLSGGERKKVFLAVGFSLKPKWLLLDEPTNNLDKQSKEVLCKLISERKGIIVISHDPVLSKCIDNVIEIKDGIIKDGSCL